jgi:hypothetical protein
MRRKLPPTARLVLAAAFYLGLTAGLGKLWSEDLWWHLETGKLIVLQHAIPHADPFSYTLPGAPWVAHEWGAEVVLYLAYALGGWLGIICLKACIVGLTALLAAYLALRWRAGALPALAGAALLALALNPWTTARPAMLDWVYLLLVLHLLTSFREGRSRALWWLPPLFLLWANTHGTFVMGWGLIALFAVCERLQPSRPRPPLRRLVWPFLASVVICLANPNFLQGALYPLTYITGANAYYNNIVSEFASPDFHQSAYFPVLALVFLTLLVLVLSPRRANWLELALVLGGLAFFLQHVRNGPLLAVFCAPILAVHLSTWLRASRWSALGDESVAAHPLRPGFAGLLAVLAMVILAAGAPHSNAPDQVIALDIPPTAATEVIRLNHPQGPMLNVYEWGGYLIWNLWPEYRVFVDGRADVYGRALIDDYLQFYHLGPQWRGILRKYKIEWLLLRPGKAPATALAAQGDYVSIYRDDTAELFVRKGGPNQRLIDLASAGKLLKPSGVVGPRR